MSNAQQDNLEPPWWLEPGTECCVFCFKAYHEEAGYFCVECDRPVCLGCVVEVHETREVICPACGEMHRVPTMIDLQEHR